MNIFLNKIFSENKFLKLSSLLFLFLPFAIISGNFLTNFLIIYSILFMIIRLILVNNIKFFYTKEFRYLTIFFIPFN